VGGALNYIYRYFDVFDNNLNNAYASYSTFFEFAKNCPNEFYGPDFFFKYIYLYTELLFLVTRIRPSRKKRKKTMQTKLRISYLSKYSRQSVTIRLINSYLVNFDAQNNILRFGDALLYLSLEGKNSFLYKKKLAMYSKILEKKKFY
jgi:hypothetical protein